MVARGWMAALLLLLGCTTNRTEVVIGVATDLDAPSQMGTVRMTVSREDVPLIEQVWDLPGIPAQPFELPGSFGLYTDDGSEPRITVEVVGLLGSDRLITRRSVFALVREQTLFLRMTLVEACVHRSDCAPGQTCIEGHCTPEAIDAHLFPTYVQGMELTVSCSSGTVYRDTGTKQPLEMSGPGCAPDQLCSEGTCLRKPQGTPDGGIAPDGGGADGGTGSPARFAYASVSGLNQIQIFSITAQTGELTPAATPSQAATDPAGLQVDPSNQFLVATSNSGSQLLSYRIDTGTGALTSIGPLATGTNPIALVIHPAGFVYAANKSANSLSIARLDGTSGVLSSLGSQPVGASPQWVTLDPTGHNLYVVNTTDATVSTFTVDGQSGALTPVGAPVVTGLAPTFVLVHPAGGFVYTANSNTNDVTIFRRDLVTGALSTAATAAAGMTARSLAIEPSGRFAYVADFGAAQVSLFTIDAGTGGLTPLGTPVALLASPYFLTVDPSGGYLYCVNQTPGTVRPLRIDSQSGALTFAQSTAVGGGTPIAITFAR
jgi:6-phosphogluconolactonase (cycloisomerase 2 family)